MKRLVAIFTILAVVFVGCGGSDDSSDSDDCTDAAGEPSESPCTAAPLRATMMRRKQ